MLLRFTKMHGLGNDFMVVDLISQKTVITAKQVRIWSDRHTGVGFDQLLLVEPPKHPEVDFYYRILNADGSEVEQCGNGARCLMHFVVHKRLTAKKTIRVQTKSGIITLTLSLDGQVVVDMGAPRWEPAAIPLLVEQASAYQLTLAGRVITFGAVSMGNPHAVLRVEDIRQAPVAELGAALEVHPWFPERVNVGFLQVLDRQQGRLRVWERGVGETQACGTGACAAAVVAMRSGWMDSTVQLGLPGGSLQVAWAGSAHSVLMTGPAVRVYEGQIRF